MKKIEAVTLEEAYRIACDELECSFSELEYEVLQYPRQGIMGLFAKPAIIVADAKEQKSTLHSSEVERTEPAKVEAQSAPEAKSRPKEVSEPEKDASKRSVTSEVSEALEAPAESVDPEAPGKEETSEERILDGFFSEEGALQSEEKAQDRNLQLQEEIEEALKELISKSCFDIDVVEVDVIGDTAYIFIDGEDAALIIGKEGYRYNALSYLLYNWIHSRYQLYVKLEIARFLASQEEMIRSFIQPVIEHVRNEGSGRTRTLDGILVQIALEQLREAFPDKYVAIKRQRDGKRYILINEFNRRK